MPNENIIFDQTTQVMSNTSGPFAPGSLKIIGGMQIPFATGDCTYTITTSTTGAPTRVITSAFGAPEGSSYITLNNAQTYPNLGGNFTTTYNTSCYFFLPYPATIKGISFAATYNFTGSTPANAIFNGTTYPFVTLATSLPTTSGTAPTFNLLSSTQTITEFPFISGSYVGSSVTLNGETMDLDISIPAGTVVAIVCGLFQTDRLSSTNLSSTTYLNYSGSILLA